jgi:Skp family chaperone for outer membrane proteins
MINKLVLALALASAVTVAAPVVAQTLPPAVIVVVDLDQVFQASAAGKTAQTELKARLDGIQSRLASLRTSFGAEEQTLAKAQPEQGATPAVIQAWQAKVKDFTTRKTQAEQELQKRDQDFQASRQYVLKQINDGAQPIITQIMKERGASIAVPEGATLQHAASIDVTNDVIARIDKSLPRVSTTAPAAPAAK